MSELHPVFGWGLGQAARRVTTSVVKSRNMTGEE
jgi:hypothetical protein